MARPFQNVVYLQIRRQWLGIQVLTFSGRIGQWSGVPEGVFGRSLGGKKSRNKVYAPSDPMAYTMVDPVRYVAFDHPRVIIDDFDKTLEVVKLYLSRSGLKKGVVPRTFLIHVRDEWEGGVTQIEKRALLELCRVCGASRAFLIDKPGELSAPEVLRIARNQTSVAPALPAGDES